MSPIRIVQFQTILGILSLLVIGCSEQPAATQLSPSVTPDPFVMESGPDEIIHLAGEVSYKSAPFTLDGPGFLKTYWRQDCVEFSLEMISTNDTLAEAPGGYVIFESWFGPSEYVADDPVKAPYQYVPGEYVFVVEAVEPCEWEVWAKVVFPGGE
ncbi:MAG: hypothetical protein ISR58_18645 [Anaerolineales bacterium]|nr:hypothetical protein [Chloroflexota bacterium]MBL6983200.1 hypothetical protein [Anaerolineales bacterium]